MKIRRFFALSVIYFFVVLGAVAGYHLSEVGVSREERVYGEMLELIDRFYIEPVQMHRIIANSLEGIVEAIGPEDVGLEDAGNELILRVSGNEKFTLDKEGDTEDLASDFMEAFELVASAYGDNEDRGVFLDLAFHEAVRPLDPHSSFFTRSEYEELRNETEGHFGGVGIEISVRNDELTVISPLEGTPAHQAGIMAGDRIVKVDGRSTRDMSLFTAVDLIRGEIGTVVILSVKREGEKRLLDFPLVRSRIEIQAVKWRMLPENIGYIRLIAFNENVGSGLEDALSDMESIEGGLRGIILDMRNNPGGLLTQAIQVADKFLDTGLIVYMAGRDEKQRKEYHARPRGSRTLFPMVILVNNGSASASEIVAGALKDHRRALILGNNTWGKGSVQSIYPMSTGNALRLTTALYYTPSGRSIQARGIAPHVEFLYHLEDGSPYHPFTEQDLTGHLANDSHSKRESASYSLEAEKVLEHYRGLGELGENAPAPGENDFQILLARDILKSATDADSEHILKNASSLLNRMK